LYDLNAEEFVSPYKKGGKKIFEKFYFCPWILAHLVRFSAAKKEQVLRKKVSKSGKIEKEVNKRSKKSTGFLITPLKRCGGFQKEEATEEPD
jgi:hypothetical protein